MRYRFLNLAFFYLMSAIINHHSVLSTLSTVLVILVGISTKGSRSQRSDEDGAHWLVLVIYLCFTLQAYDAYLKKNDIMDYAY